MDDAHRLDALRTDASATARAAEDRLDVPVPHLDWAVGEVVEHLGGVHQRFTRCLVGEVDRWPARDDVTGPDGDVLGWFRSGVADLVGALGEVDPDATVVTWLGDRDRSWVLRRLANETAVHRWDVEAAVGTPEPIEATRGEDVIHEFLTVIVGDRGLPGVDDLPAHDGATLHLHGTDAETAEWYATVVGDGLEVERRHEKGDVALRGPTGDLALWLNGRIPPSRLDAFGEPEAVDWWSRAFRFE